MVKKLYTGIWCLMKLKHFETFTVKCFCKYGISKYILRLWKIKMICLHKPRKTKFYSFPHNVLNWEMYFFMHVSVHSTSHDTLSAGTSCARLPDLHANVWLNVLLFYIMHFFPVVGLLHKVHDKNKVVVKNKQKNNLISCKNMWEKDQARWHHYSWI